MKRVVATVAIVIAAQFGALAACATLGPKERAEVAHTAATLEQCQEQGRMCKADGGAGCYDACMRDAGLR